MTEGQIHDVIKNGLPGGMPAFDLPRQQLQSLAAWVKSLNTLASTAQTAGDKAAGEHFFFGQGQCSTCHMVHGCRAVLKSDLPHFRCRVKLRLKHSKAALALLAARNLPAHTSAA
jgi:mono/diheme cytochrome c family protein